MINYASIKVRNAAETNSLEYNILSIKCKGSLSPQTYKKPEEKKPETPIDLTNLKKESKPVASKSAPIKLPDSTSSNPEPEIILSREDENKNLITELGSKKNEPRVPEYQIVHAGEFDFSDYTLARVNTKPIGVPKQLVVKVKLPTLDSASGIDLDIAADRLYLRHSEYKLDVALPFKVHDEKGSAKFDKKLHQLIVTLPVNYEFKETVFEFLEPEIVESSDEEQICSEPEVSNSEPVEEIAEAPVATTSIEEKECKQVTPTTEPEIKTESLPSNDLRTEIEHVAEPVQAKPLPSFVTETKFTNKYLTDID